MIDLGGWNGLLADELAKPYFAALMERVEAAYARGAVFPPQSELFAAFRLTPPERVRAVILGQDPYHEPGQAHGLAFSVRAGVKLPPSLRNIFRELESDCGVPPRESGDLTGWAEQGVFLLNTVLSVESGKANSHANFGWQTFTDAVSRACAACRSRWRSSSGARRRRKKPPSRRTPTTPASSSKPPTPAPSAPTEASSVASRFPRSTPFCGKMMSRSLIGQDKFAPHQSLPLVTKVAKRRRGANFLLLVETHRNHTKFSDSLGKINACNLRGVPL